MNEKLKRKIDYELQFEEDVTNRCVICWLYVNPGSLFEYLRARQILGMFELRTTFKATAHAHNGDPWDPEGLKRLGAQKGTPQILLAVRQFFPQKCRGLFGVGRRSTMEYAAFLNRYWTLDAEITSHAYYENWRKQKTKE